MDKKWLKTFPVPEESPTRHVSGLRFTLGGYYGAPEGLCKYTLRFPDVEKMNLLGHRGFRPLWIPSFVRLPQSVTSLTSILVRVRNIILQLPNLDDLLLSGSFIEVECTFPGMGAMLRGRFGGQL